MSTAIEHNDTQESDKEVALDQPSAPSKLALSNLYVAPSLAMLLLTFVPVPSPWDDLLSTLGGDVLRPPGKH